jgi:hypothetical protein
MALSIGNGTIASWMKGSAMNKQIKQFELEGVIGDDAALPKSKEWFGKLVQDSMRDLGYVPVLDLDTHWYVDYNPGKDTYNFKIILFGIFVGKRKQAEIVGYSGQSFIRKG